MKYRILVLASMLTVVHMPIANAFENVEFSGYMTVMGTYAKVKKKANPEQNTKYDNSFASDRIDFDTRANTIGFQASAGVTDKLDVTLVLQALGGNDQYNISAEWAYANYLVSDDFTVRLGRFKGPFFMVSEYSTVGYAYPWVTLPHEVYSTNPMTAVTGLDFVYNTGLGDWDFLFEVYTGSGKHKATALPTFVGSSANTMGLTNGSTVNFSTDGMVGFNTSIGTRGISLRAGYFSTGVSIPSFSINTSRGNFGGVGLIIDWRDILVYSEYIIRDTSSELLAAFPDQKAWYTTLGYRFGDFMPYVTLGGIDEGKDASPYAVKQSSVSLGFRYEVGATSAIKFEVHQAKTDSVSGTTAKYGLFDDPIKDDKGNVFAASFDLIF
ncbi:MAG TPA: hypothetical protein ENI98_00675 [Gammaproteobacteria bacterium]|nr:hypothetical protein [Gammaproteobacteria bacterium]